MKKILYLIYQPYKWLFFFPLLFIDTLLFGGIAVIVSFVIHPKAGGCVGVAWAKFNSFFTPLFVDVSGKQHIIKNTSYVIVANHQSYYDILLIYGWLGIDIKWVMKKELRKVPGLGIACEKIGHIFLDRSHSKNAITALNDAKKKLINGTSVVIFPEGTRSKTGELHSFKRGAFKLAFDLGLPILPVTLVGTNHILPADSYNLLPGKVSMIIHQPIDIKKYNEGDILLLMKEVSCSIALKIS